VGVEIADAGLSHAAAIAQPRGSPHLPFAGRARSL
jgi:hypothetical protein